MPRYRIIVEYDGTPFVGWQQQTTGASVQGALSDAIAKFAGETVSVRGAGRTDAGVHATGQVAHFDLSRDWDPFRIQEAMNFHLKPHPIAVLACDRAASGFDARFSATARHYRYRIMCRRARPVLERDRVWWLTIDLDHEAMRAGAEHFLGHHDFTTFRASQCQAPSPCKTVDVLTVTRLGGTIEIDVSARSFLHNQVRSMVGSLKLVGEGKWPPQEVAAALAARDRARCGPVAPSAGLYLIGVDYARIDAAADQTDADQRGGEQDDE